MKKLVSIFLALCLMACLAALPLAAPESGNTYAPPANLNELSQAEQLAYFNLAVNRVRAQRPGFAQRERLRIDSVRSSILGGIADGIINSIVKDRMPGGWEQQTIAAGRDNTGQFLSKNANASDLSMQDITAISSTKIGDNWDIMINIAESVNPAAGTACSMGHIAPIATREQIADELNPIGAFVEPVNINLRYHSGYARVTVNPEGKVISATTGYQVHAQATGVSISILRGDITAEQTSEWQYDAFDWNIPWYFNLPSWLQWILRYIFFGWIWMQ